MIERALRTGGLSADVIYLTAAAALRLRGARGVLVDVGCGVGRFREFTREVATGYIGVDVIRHKRLPPDVPFLQADLDRDPIPMPSESAGIVAAIEALEHLENPRALFRELVRVLHPGGWLVASTPNQLSVTSLLSLLLRGEFAAFQAASYPAHRTALLPVDLERIAAECALGDVAVEYTLRGRVPLTAVHYPRALSWMLPRALSDNVLLLARKGA